MACLWTLTNHDEKPKFKVPYSQKVSAKKLWEREHGQDIRDAIQNLEEPNRPNGRSIEFNFYSKVAKDMWEKVDRAEKKVYQKQADSLNDGTASLEEKRA